MDEGGWMDIHTVCFILQTRRGFQDVCVGDIAILIHTSQGERYEVAICRPVPDDEDAVKALGCGADVKDVDPLRGKPRMQFDPRDNPYQSPGDRPAGGGYYVGVRAIQGQSVPGVLDLRLYVPLYERVHPFFDLIWHATHWGNALSLIHI